MTLVLVLGCLLELTLLRSLKRSYTHHIIGRLSSSVYTINMNIKNRNITIERLKPAYFEKDIEGSLLSSRHCCLVWHYIRKHGNAQWQMWIDRMCSPLNQLQRFSNRQILCNARRIDNCLGTSVSAVVLRIPSNVIGINRTHR